jgi:hypothetical protein
MDLWNEVNEIKMKETYISSQLCSQYRNTKAPPGLKLKATN